jgi:hypothetical protein
MSMKGRYLNISAGKKDITIIYTAVGVHCADHATLSIIKS